MKTPIDVVLTVIFIIAYIAYISVMFFEQKKNYVKYDLGFIVPLWKSRILHIIFLVIISSISVFAFGYFSQSSVTLWIRLVACSFFPVVVIFRSIFSIQRDFALSNFTRRLPFWLNDQLLGFEGDFEYLYWFYTQKQVLSLKDYRTVLRLTWIDVFVRLLFLLLPFYLALQPLFLR